MKKHRKGLQPFASAGGKLSIFLSESPRLSRVRFSRKNFRFKLPSGHTPIKFNFFGRTLGRNTLDRHNRVYDHGVRITS
jgi:hypothetical protein